MPWVFPLSEGNKWHIFGKNLRIVRKDSSVIYFEPALACFHVYTFDKQINNVNE